MSAVAKDDMRELAVAVRALREEVARLTDRVAALETGAAVTARDTAQTGAQVAAPQRAAELSEELILVISAAVAAYLGKKPCIRQIRLVTSPTWTHQGRVTIQGSHVLTSAHR